MSETLEKSSSLGNDGTALLEKLQEENKQLRESLDSEKKSARAARKIAGQRLDFIGKMEKELKRLRRDIESIGREQKETNHV